MSKEIYYDGKITAANTQYNSIENQDMSWLTTELVRYLTLMGELANDKNPLVKQIVRDYWSKKSDTLPRGRNGQNSPESFVSGLLNNILYGNQRDLSDVQMDALVNISAKMSCIYDAVKLKNLQPNFPDFEEIIFRTRLFS